MEYFLVARRGRALYRTRTFGRHFIDRRLSHVFYCPLNNILVLARGVLFICILARRRYSLACDIRPSGLVAVEQMVHGRHGQLIRISGCHYSSVVIVVFWTHIIWNGPLAQFWSML